MRIDKFLKVSRLIKRRTVANAACDAEKIELNGRVVKPGTRVKVGDVISVTFMGEVSRYEVLSIQEHVRKEEAAAMYRRLDGEE